MYNRYRTKAYIVHCYHPDFERWKTTWLKLHYLPWKLYIYKIMSHPTHLQRFKNRLYWNAELKIGLHLDAGLSWMIHINTIVSKTSKRLYFLKHLRRAGVPPLQLFHFYTAVIRPVLQYASPVWHYSITQAQSQHLESIQKRAVHTFYPRFVIS